MNRKVIIVAILIFAVCIPTALYLKKKKNEKDMEAAQKRFLFQDKEFIEPGDIVELEITNPSGNLKFVKKNDEWLMKAPEESRINTEVIDLLIYRLVTMKLDRVVEEKPKDLSIYGLDNPDINVAFRLKDETKWRRVDFGKRSPINSTYYAMEPDTGIVVLLPYELKFDFNYSKEMFKSNKLIPFERGSVGYVSIEYPDKTYEFEYNYETEVWWQKQPEIVCADSENTYNLIQLFQGYGIDMYVAKDTIFHDSDFADPIYKATFINKMKESRTVIIGKKIDRGYPAKIVESGELFMVSSDALINKLSKLLEKTEKTNAIDLQYAFKSITITMNDKRISISQGKIPGQWLIDGDVNKKADLEKISLLTNSILSAKNLGYVGGATLEKGAAQYGLDFPAVTIDMTLMNENGTKRILYVGKKTPDETNVYVASNEDPYVRVTGIGILKFIGDDPNFYMTAIQ